MATFDLEKAFKDHKHTGQDSKTLWTKQAKISDPSGGANPDPESRAAINSIIDALEEVGILKKN